MIIKARDGTSTHLLKNLTVNSTYDHLLSEVSLATNQGKDDIRVKYGYPPRLLNARADQLLTELGLASGDTIIIEKISGAGNADPSNETKKTQESTTDGPKLVRRTMPDDNSCLFYSISYVLEDKNLSKAQELRQVIATTIQHNPSIYSDAILGRNNLEYCHWIMESNSWGGGIELSIFSELYQVEIIAVDIQHVRLDRFGEDRHYANRVMVIYDGIHYDALALSPYRQAPQEVDITLFSCEDDSILAQALSIAEQARKMHHYTDLANFTLKCTMCHTGIEGEKGATLHAKQTGHTNFTEYS